MLYQIYLVTNKINNKQYVGQTKQSIGYIERFKRHCSNKTNDLFHNALKKYGPDNFEVSLLENNISEEIVDEREKY